MKKFDVAYLIDDDRIYTHLLSRQMKMVEFCDSIVVFNDGEEALMLLKSPDANSESLPSVILLDISMPILDGWQFLDLFNKLDLPKKIDVFMVSSSIDEADKMKAASYANVSNFYIKPLSQQNLIEIMNAVDG